MVDEIHQQTAVIPAGTLKTALATISIDVPPWPIDQIDLEVPPGPNGAMGFYLAVGGVSWIPWETDEFFVWDDRAREYPLQRQPDTNDWSVVGYNLGQFDHSVIVRFHLNTAGQISISSPTLTIVQNAPTPPLVTL